MQRGYCCCCGAERVALTHCAATIIMPILFGVEDPARWRAALNSYENELQRASTGRVRASPACLL